MVMGVISDQHVGPLCIVAMGDQWVVDLFD